MGLLDSFKSTFTSTGEASVPPAASFATREGVIYAPVNGVLVNLDEVPDETIASGMLGQGYGIEPITGTIYAPANGRIGAHRLAAIRRILEKRGQYDPRTFHVGEISRESGYALAKKAVEDHTLAEAVLLGSDEVAEGALEAFRELGVRVPKDVAVIIYQDIQTLESKWPTGTCLEMFPDYVWENALELLFGRISQRRSQAVTVTVPTHLKIGDTA